MTRTEPSEAKAPLWESEEARRVLDTMAEFFCALDREYRIVFVNKSLADLSQGRIAIGQCHWDIWPEMRGSVVEESYERAFRTGIPVRFEYQYQPTGRWVDVNAYPTGDHLHIYFRDTTKEKRGKESQQALIDAIPHIAWATDADGAITYINAKWREFTGTNGMDVAEIRSAIHPDDLEGVIANMKRLRETGEHPTYDCRLRRHDGEYRWHRVKASPMWETSTDKARSDSRGPTGWIGTSTDVHEEVLAYESLRESAEHYRFRIESSPQVPWLADAQGQIYDFGAQWLALTGMTKEEALGSQVTILHPEDAPRMMETWTKCLETGEPFDLTHRIRVANGEYRWMRSRAMAKRDEHGNILRWYGTTEDIHDYRTAQAELERAQRSLALAIKAGRMGWWTRNLTTQEVTWSPELEALFGLEPGSFKGTEESFLAYVHPNDVPLVTAAVTEAIKERSDYSVEFRFKRTDGTQGWMDGRGRALYDDAGTPVWLYGIGIDITDRKLAHQQQAEVLEKLVDERTAELQIAYREQESFSYSVSHDLRSPLRAIIATSRMLEEDHSHGLSEEAKKLLSKQANAASKLAHLIDDLLDLSRVGRMELALTTVDLTRLFSDAAEAHQSGTREAANGTQPVRFEIEEGLSVIGDAKLLALVVQNLLENAVKFSPNGGTIRVGCRGGAFFVADEGVGFEMEYVHKLFQPFQRLHREDEFAGTGIGLATVRRIVERHHGRIWAESEPGKGSTFWFTLP